MLYQIKKGKSIFESNQGLRLIPEFANIESDPKTAEKFMEFVILVADYQSPLRQHPEKKRRELAVLAAGGKVQNANHAALDLRSRELVEGKNEKVELAIRKYRQIQHNDDKEMLDVISTQIEAIKTTVLAPSADVDELAKRNKLLQTIPDLIETKKRLARITGIEDEVFLDETTTETKPMSLIDKVALENQNK